MKYSPSECFTFFFTPDLDSPAKLDSLYNQWRKSDRSLYFGQFLCDKALKPEQTWDALYLSKNTSQAYQLAFNHILDNQMIETWKNF